MDILHDDNHKKGEFYILKDIKKIAAITYTWAGNDKIIIDHTEVDESLKGQKIGYKLVEKVVTFARNKKIKILPLCPFANYVLHKNSNYKDILF
ncbi:GNAT family N-acetyltransferase [uncultured Polaribacter sp.]|uniref:GNAT family N-acetyltransferase n=1 Tax=uncultured Polaribacter sp. TaxID=174711 RepID=UPI002612E2F8|nr:GNAT family N-acetyltransferase [uncultured Polaribacter sp.]